MYNKLSFTNNDKTNVMCVTRAAEGVEVNENV